MNCEGTQYFRFTILDCSFFVLNGDFFDFFDFFYRKGRKVGTWRVASSAQRKIPPFKSRGMFCGLKAQHIPA